MTQAFRYPSSTNFHPALSNLAVGFLREQDQFPQNKYIQYVQAPSPHYWYTKIDRDEIVRMRQPRDYLWADGAKRFSTGVGPTEINVGFREQEVFLNRYAFVTTIGNQTLNRHEDQWGYKRWLLKTLVSKAMTSRAIILWQGGPGGGSEGTTTNWGGLDNASSWPSTNTADANTLNGGAGSWATAGSDPGNPGTYMAIRKSIMTAVNQIFLQTNGVVSYEQLRMVISPNLAKIISNTDEIRDAYKYGPFAKEMIEGGKQNYNDRFGLPPYYAGVEIVVENTPYTNDLPTAGQTTYSTSRAYVKADNKACILTRQGAIDSPGGPSFSTVQLAWFQKQLGTQEFVDAEDELTKMSVVDYYAVIGPAMEAGYLITGCF
ncbi:MAG: hypothetical protein KGL39_29685 [Patescibacteria group bacterium]|nr:hypothetical protein [Patescibacteria group bacterium]